MTLDAALHAVEAIHEYGGAADFGPGVCTLDIVEGCRVSERTARRYLDELAEHGFITQAATDKRGYHWRLTVSGRALLRAAQGHALDTDTDTGKEQAA